MFLRHFIQLAFCLIILSLPNTIIYGRNFGEIINKCFDYSDENDFWLAKMALDSLANDPIIGQCTFDLCIQLRMLKAIHKKQIIDGHFNECAGKPKIIFPSGLLNEYIELKSRMEFLKEADPAAAHLVEELLLLIGSHAQWEIEGDSKMINLKAKLANAIRLLAKRQKVSLAEIEPLNGLNGKELLQELANEWTEWRKSKAKNSQKCHNDQNQKDGQNRHNSHGRRMLRLLMTSVDNMDAMPNLIRRATSVRHRRHRRRRRRRDIDSFGFAVICFCIFTLLLLIWAVEFHCTDRHRPAQIREPLRMPMFVEPIRPLRREPPHRRESTTRQQLQQMNMGRRFLDAYKEFPQMTVVAPRHNDGSSTGNNNINCECAVCLSGIEPGTLVRPLPACKHIFHEECIELWLNGGHNLCPICRTKIFIFRGQTVEPNRQIVSGSYQSGIAGHGEYPINIDESIDNDQNLIENDEPSVSDQASTSKSNHLLSRK